jgi:hypothetical protein
VTKNMFQPADEIDAATVDKCHDPVLSLEKP